jgi:type IV secretory pathway VirB4 component
MKRKKTDYKSSAAVISKKPISEIDKKDRAMIQARMNEIKKYKDDASTVQNTIGYTQMFKDGVCQIDENRFSKTIQFFDTNYQLAEFEEQNNIFSKYCDLINYFDNTVTFQLTFENQNRSQDKLVKSIQIPQQEDEFNEIRQEYSEMLTNKLLSGKNGQSSRKFLTFTIESGSYKQARAKLLNIQTEVIKMFKSFGVESKALNGKQRLETLYYSLNPFRDSPFVFDWNEMAKSGLDTKDFISPSSFKFNKQNFEIGSAWGSINCMSILAGELPDTILNDFLELQHLFCVNIHVEPLDQITALKFVKTKLTGVEEMKINEQKKASKAGYDPDILPPSIKMYITDLEKLLDDLNSKNERLFHINISIRNYARNKKDLKLQLELLKRICQKNNCTLMNCDYLQEDYLTSTLPLGVNRILVSREMHTSGVAIFVPFTTQELFQSDGTYYGLNTVSGNMIMANRSNLKNPNGLILGTPGSGKSFSVKREILDSFLKTTDDIIICDPEGEYFPLVQALQGQLVRISSNSDQYINPMDINFDSDIDDNPISMKSDFLISLCEIIVGGKYGLTAEERSVIDKCVRKIYLDFLKDNPTKEKMPILSDLHKALIREGDIATRVANSLEMYVNGSQNLFNHQTNIDLQNRVICFDIKELGNQLKKVGMLIVQDNVWNRVTLNRAERKVTRYYMDEFHLLLKEEQTAKYSAEIWKRFRKWGGVPTGITQNVKDLLSSQEVENIFDNSDFVYMLNQAAGDREILAEKLHISPQQMEFVTNSGPGEGLIRYDKIILPFTDNFPTDTLMYRLLTTKPMEQKLK